MEVGTTKRKPQIETLPEKKGRKEKKGKIDQLQLGDQKGKVNTFSYWNFEEPREDIVELEKPESK